MAVYTDVSGEDLAAFLAGYDLGELLSYKGIAEGVENSNFVVHTRRGYFILTLYEKRVAASDLPFFLGLMEHLASRGLTCPQPVKNRAGNAAGTLAGRPAAIVTFLEGMWLRRPGAAHCASVGEGLARLHVAGADFAMTRKNALSVEGWHALYETAASRADTLQPGLNETIARELGHLEQAWRRDLPQGVIHADLFPDNVFFLGDRLSGLIDFYFACTDTLAYDVAICLNAWCFEAGPLLQRDEGAQPAAGLFDGPALGAGRTRGAAAARARRGVAFPAHPPGGLAQRAGGRAGQAEGPDRVLPQAQIPSRRSRACATTASTGSD